MGNFNNKLAIKIKLLNKRNSEVFRRIGSIIDIPLKTILKTNIIDLDIKLKYFEAFLFFRSECSMMTYSFLNCIDDLVLEWHQ